MFERGFGYIQEMLYGELPKSEQERIDQINSGLVTLNGSESWIGRRLHESAIDIMMCAKGITLLLSAVSLKNGLESAWGALADHEMSQAWDASKDSVVYILECSGFFYVMHRLQMYTRRKFSMPSDKELWTDGDTNISSLEDYRKAKANQFDPDEGA